MTRYACSRCDRTLTGSARDWHLELDRYGALRHLTCPDCHGIDTISFRGDEKVHTRDEIIRKLRPHNEDPPD